MLMYYKLIPQFCDVRIAPQTLIYKMLILMDKASCQQK